jgi:glycosyltransferase involved in cell wall biosynthesis
MRVLYASTGPPYPTVVGSGAARSAHQLLDSLTGLGVTCAAAGEVLPGDTERTVEGRYALTLSRDLLADLDGLIARFRPDVVCTHLERALDVVACARRRDVRAAWFLRNAECAAHPPADLQAARALGARFFASSRFLVGHLWAEHGIAATVSWPPIAVDAYRVPLVGPEGCITMINPVAVKGVATVMGLIHRLPDRQFLIVEGWPLGEQRWAALKGALAGFPHVRLERAVDDMRAIYARTRVLIVPSVWEEGFGRVVAEAHASGIPVVASKVGGLADLGAGTVLIDEYTDADAWADALETVLADPARHAHLSAEALNAAETAPYRAERVAQQFLEDLAAPDPRVQRAGATTPMV